MNTDEIATLKRKEKEAWEGYLKELDKAKPTQASLTRLGAAWEEASLNLGLADSA